MIINSEHALEYSEFIWVDFIPCLGLTGKFSGPRHVPKIFSWNSEPRGSGGKREEICVWSLNEAVGN